MSFSQSGKRKICKYNRQLMVNRALRKHIFIYKFKKPVIMKISVIRYNENSSLQA